MISFSRIFCMMLLTLFTASSAYGDIQGYLALDNGYRWDRLSNRAQSGGGTVPAKGSTQLMRKINSYQLGAKGQWLFCDTLFVRANGHYGWVFEGKYSEGGLFGKTTGHTTDVQGAIGKYICIAPGIWVAPVIGWSYDALHFKGKNISTAINGVVYKLNDLQAHQRFNGPFIGIDLNYQINSCYDFTFGYEFHCVHWRGQRLIQGREYGNPPFGITTGFSNVRRMNRVYGNVFKFDATYEWRDCWELGLGLKYQFFMGDDGHYRQTKKRPLSQYTYRKIEGLWWCSFAATLYIGKMF